MKNRDGFAVGANRPWEPGAGDRAEVGWGKAKAWLEEQSIPA